MYPGCSLGIGDQRILRLTFRSYGNFYSDLEPLSKYSPVMLHLSPATRILNKNPVCHCTVINSVGHHIYFFIKRKELFQTIALQVKLEHNRSNLISN